MRTQREHWHVANGTGPNHTFPVRPQDQNTAHRTDEHSTRVVTFPTQLILSNLKTRY